jgi:putative flippase GtrA
LHWLVEGHWLGRWRTPKLLKLWRYGAGSIVAFVTSIVAYYVCYSWAHLGAITSTWIAFVAGAVPNWVLNRRWAWQKRGREGMTRETTLYVIVSLISVVVSSVFTKLTAHSAEHLANHLDKDLLVTGSYMLSVIVLTGLKYVAYDRFVFVERRSSRAQVPTTTEQNRTP